MSNISEIKKFIKKGKTDEALEALVTYSKSKSPEVQHQALVLSSRFKQFEDDKIMGVSDSNVELRRIEAGILDLISESSSKSKSLSEIAPTQLKKKFPYITVLLAVGMLAFAAAYFVKKQLSEDILESGYTLEDNVIEGEASLFNSSASGEISAEDVTSALGFPRSLFMEWSNLNFYNTTRFKNSNALLTKKFSWTTKLLFEIKAEDITVLPESDKKRMEITIHRAHLSSDIKVDDKNVEIVKRQRWLDADAHNEEFWKQLEESKSSSIQNVISSDQLVRKNIEQSIVSSIAGKLQALKINSPVIKVENILLNNRLEVIVN